LTRGALIGKIVLIGLNHVDVIRVFESRLKSLIALDIKFSTTIIIQTLISCQTVARGFTPQGRRGVKLFELVNSEEWIDI
jgi:hypothetical protein